MLKKILFSIQAKSSKESSLNQLDLKTKQEIFQNDPSSYNGAKLDKYSWTQTIKEIDVRVKVRVYRFKECD